VLAFFWINIASGSLNNRNYIVMWMRTIKADAIQSVDIQVLAEYVVVVSEVGLYACGMILWKVLAVGLRE